MFTRRAHNIAAINSANVIGEFCEPRKSGIEQPHSAAKCAALQMVIRGCDLNESLQKLIEVGFCREPELFPRLMRFPELERIEMVDAGAEVPLEVRLDASRWLSSPS